MLTDIHNENIPIAAEPRCSILFLIALTQNRISRLTSTIVWHSASAKHSCVIDNLAAVRFVYVYLCIWKLHASVSNAFVKCFCTS